jgi:hypothetical protein
MVDPYNYYIEHPFDNEGSAISLLEHHVEVGCSKKSNAQKASDFRGCEALWHS